MYACGDIDVDSEIPIIFGLKNLAGLWFGSDTCRVVAKRRDEPRAFQESAIE